MIRTNLTFVRVGTIQPDEKSYNTLYANICSQSPNSTHLSSNCSTGYITCTNSLSFLTCVGSLL